MARPSQSIDEIIASAVSDAIQKVAPALHRHIALLAAAELEKSLAVNGARAPRAAAARRSRPRGAEMTKWVADRKARRVPKFVIQATGLDTKKKIVAKFGENAEFLKDKPLPKPSKAA
jgi:hypothetical protein